ncbi:GSCFA domain-containing protein [Ichthyenterobacterium magnum]|uniref:GSCFA family protein n=1 Tax=Ichthyenterobacterium magnum TaxID=1230530 RepID=A0A420DVH0_9FLAO|nr:GSCFA domain-containing protein [Ichthyenterobacterium magnum]RKE98219.1 GSCFA family protein [Ichthyenterobacterium magnum]
MKLQTQISLKKQSNNLIDYKSNILLVGSCFVENIGEKLNYFKFQNAINPFGILFHPLAIETFLTNAINEKKYTEQDIFFHNERWHCFDAHSQLSATSKEELLESLNRNIQLTNKQINVSTHIIITLGTAWLYRFIETDSYVANCHKIPQKQFLKELLSVDAIVESLESTMALIKSVNSKVSVVFTVSPVRHLKDGFVENAQSKAHLISAIHQVVESKKQQYYFPSYEIMMDELRDYRFYTDDMIHPNQTAINYIWNKFQAVWISESSNETMEDVNSIQKGLLHRPFNPKSNTHQLFLQKLENKKAIVNSKFPHIIF